MVAPHSRFGGAIAQLAEAKTVQETKKIVDVAHAAEIYAKRQKVGTEAVTYATEIKVEALKQLGRQLIETPRASGGEHGGKPRIDSTRVELSNPTPTLSDLGIEKKPAALRSAAYRKRAPKLLDWRDSSAREILSNALSAVAPVLRVFWASARNSLRYRA